MSSRHDWNSWDQYWAIHDRFIQDYRDHFILDDTLAPEITANLVRWDGALYCVDGIEIAVSKIQDVRLRGGRAQVKTRRYAYQVHRRVGDRVLSIFRYDNFRHFGPGEASPHHVHRFDENGDEVEVRPLTDDWPTLGDVIAEAYDWHDRHRS
ncbi:MAG: DUF6516 family protein [Dehalococcoidia bacterium]